MTTTNCDKNQPTVLQTALIIAGPGVTVQNASKQHIHSKCYILSLKANIRRLKNKSCNRNERKQYTNTW